MPEEQPKEKQITLTFGSSKQASQVVDLLVRKRPPGWSRRSYASYYKAIYAEWIQKDIDDMMSDRSPRVYRYDLFPNLSENSLYLRINQSILYLLDYMDSPDLKYKKFMELVHIKKVPKVGIRLSLDELLESEHPRAEVVVPESDTPKWRRDMDDYLEDETKIEPFHKDGLLLTPEQVAQIELELSGLSNIMCSVNSREIKIIKL